MSPVDEVMMANQISALSSRWKEFTNSAYRDRCFQFMKDLPHSAMSEAVESILDNFRFCPLPKDFGEAALAWRQRFVQEHGFAYGTVSKEKQEPEPCSDCMDTGYMFCKLTEELPETLVFCHCEIGGDKSKSDSNFVPRWERGIYDKAYGFIKIPFPTEKFIPKGPTNFGKENLKSNETVVWWTNRKRQARDWWKLQAKQTRSE